MAGNDAPIFLTEAEAAVDAEMQEEEDVAAEEAAAKEKPEEAKPEAQAEPEAPAAETPAEEAPPVVEEQDVRDPRIQIVVSPPPQDYDKHIAAIATQKDALDKRLEDGELTTIEWRKQHDVLTKQEFALELQRRDAVNAEKTNEENARQVFRDLSDQFRDEHPELKGAVLGAAWNAAFKQLLAETKGTADEGRSMYWHISTAYKRMNEELGLTTAAQPKPQPKPAPVRTRPAAPTSLAAVPAAASVDTGTSEFAKLDSLEGLDLETAVARLPKDQYERYLLGQ